MYVQNKIPYKTYISDFSSFKNYGMVPICNLFIEWPSYLVDLETQCE